MEAQNQNITLDLTSLLSIQEACASLKQFYEEGPTLPFKTLDLLDPGTQGSTGIQARINWKNLYCTGIVCNGNFQEIHVSYPPEAEKFDLIRLHNIPDALSGIKKKDLKLTLQLTRHIAFLVCEGTRFGNWWSERLFSLSEEEADGLSTIPSMSIEGTTMPANLQTVFNNKTKVSFLDVAHCWSDCSKDERARESLLTPMRGRP